MIDATRFKVCEGRSGMWRYHLCPVESQYSLTALCGAETMACSAPVDTWGLVPEHMPTSYCQECERIAAEAAKEKR